MAWPRRVTAATASTRSRLKSTLALICSGRVVVLVLLLGAYVLNLPASFSFDKRDLLLPGFRGDDADGGDSASHNKNHQAGRGSTLRSSSSAAAPNHKKDGELNPRDAESRARLPSTSSSASFKCSSWDNPMTLNVHQRSITLRKKDVVHSYQDSNQQGGSGSGGGIVDRLRQVRHLTFPKYEKYLTSPPGTEHYTLLHYLVDRYGSSGDVPDCRHVVDIGTRFVASSLALGSSVTNPTRVWTFDLPQSRERELAFRGKTESQWMKQCHDAGLDVTFHNVNLLEVPEADFRRYMSTWLIVLDTAHLPRTVPFEREFVQRLQDVGYRGLLVLDDIHLNSEMKEWWIELKEGANLRTKDGLAPYSIYDVTAIGHLSGTGLVDFSNQISVFA